MEVSVLNPDVLERNTEFSFLLTLLERFKSEEPKDNFYFPCPENGPQPVTAEVICEHNSDDYRATGIIKFKNKSLNVQMNYQVQVSLNTTTSPVSLSLRFVKNTNRLAGRDHSVNKNVKSYDCVIREILTGFRVGGPYRNIVKISKR